MIIKGLLLIWGRESHFLRHNLLIFGVNSFFRVRLFYLLGFMLLRHPGLPHIIKSKEKHLQVPDDGESRATLRGHEKVEGLLDFGFYVDSALNVLSV